MADKSVLIIGGTGTLGKEIICQLLNQLEIPKITVLSRDEQKQQSMKKIYPGIKFVLGDIRDKSSISRHFIGKETVFHVAALKHIDHIEDNPVESIKTNILGSINVAECAVEHNVKYCLFSSTDKATDPINTYGHCKAISERIFLNENRDSQTHFSVYRWGNICGSNGSAIPFFIDCLKNNKTVPITSYEMTRFWINIDTAVKFMLETYKTFNIKNEILIPPIMKSARVLDVVKCLAEMLNVKSYQTILVGLRKGEKLHESLTSQHSEKHHCSLTCEKYSDQELKELLKPIVGVQKCLPLSLAPSEAWAPDTKQSLST